MKIRKGSRSYGDVVYEVVGNKVYNYSPGFFGNCGSVVYTLDGNYIREGNQSFGRIVANIENGKIREGNRDYNTVLFTIDGNKVRKGSSGYGDVVYTIEY